jgi:hypothetical protein
MVAWQRGCHAIKKTAKKNRQWPNRAVAGVDHNA